MAYPVPKACQPRGLGTWVPWCLGVARSASSPKAARALDAALPPVSGSRLAGSSAGHRLRQCPGYGHWVSYCCEARVFGLLCCVWLFAPSAPFLAGVCGLCAQVRGLPLCHLPQLGAVVRASGYGLVVGAGGYEFRLSPAHLGRSLLSVCGYVFGRNLSCLGRVCGTCLWVWVLTVPYHSLLGLVACLPMWVLPVACLMWLGCGRCWWGVRGNPLGGASLGVVPRPPQVWVGVC